MGVGAGLYMYVVVVQKFTFAISSPDEFLYWWLSRPFHSGHRCTWAVDRCDCESTLYKYCSRNDALVVTVVIVRFIGGSRNILVATCASGRLGI